MSFARGHSNNKNAKKSAREQRLQFMNSQAALIAQKKKEIEEKLAAQQNPKNSVVSPAIEESKPAIQESSQYRIPFKTVHNFLPNKYP